MADKSATEWAVFLAQVRPPLCGKHPAHRAFSVFFHRFLWGWDGLPGMHCAARARAPDARAGRKQAHVRSS